MKQERIHIYPVRRKGGTSDHRTDSSEQCWCVPELRQVCPEEREPTYCSDPKFADNGKCNKDCWRCKGTGLVEPYDDTLKVLIIHKEEQFLDGASA